MVLSRPPCSMRAGPRNLSTTNFSYPLRPERFFRAYDSAGKNSLCLRFRTEYAITTLETLTSTLATVGVPCRPSCYREAPHVSTRLRVASLRSAAAQLPD